MIHLIRLPCTQAEPFQSELLTEARDARNITGEILVRAAA